MKLLRHGPPGGEKPGLWAADGTLRDLSSVVADIDPAALDPAALEGLAKTDPTALPAVDPNTRLGPCVAGVGKIVCIGLNYKAHAAESGMEPPPEPIVFLKGARPTGPRDPRFIPPRSQATDWEVELGVVVGQVTRRVSEAEALAQVAGYCVFNDVSERDYQLRRGGQWTKGKSFEGFAPMGPWLVTRDEVPDPQALSLWLEVNGQRHQDSHTGDMIFTVAHIISYLSQFMTLYPGDLIATGTPQGVGMGLKPSPRYLQPGDEVRLGIEGLGEQHQRCETT
ncbi:MAG: fumarylacetoacetate hydrolase family protein [Candidatus Competibacterales bacterium]